MPQIMQGLAEQFTASVEDTEKIDTLEKLEFVVFCIENVAAKLGVGAERVYGAFVEKSNILYDYIVPEYESLHTQSKEYIVEDILDLMRERGVSV